MIRALAALACAVVLVGCATPADPLPSGEAGELDRFGLDGKVSWRAPDQRGRASLIWNEAPPRTRLVISGPFGAGTAVLEESAEGARLDLGERTARDIDAARLLERELGLRLPVREVRDWIRGRPSTEAAVVTARDDAGRIVALEEAGWSVRFDRYTVVDGFLLPGRVDMEREGYRLRFVATRWRPGLPEFPIDA